MKNSNKKRGFTIVELIIVIAVIAILAAVLIPTFSSLINKSLVAADESLVRNLNEALAMDVTNPHNTMTDALKATKENGFDVSKINARASTDGEKHEILWDSRNDCFVYKKGDEINYIPKSNTKGDATPVELWHIANDGTLSDKYSNYLAAGTYAATLGITTGLDVGEHKEVTEVNYTNTKGKQDVVIRTNSASTNLTVNAPLDTVTHYNKVGVVEIIAVASASYHEYGQIEKKAVINQGHIAIEEGGNVPQIFVGNVPEGKTVKVTANESTVISVDDSSASQTTIVANSDEVYVSGDVTISGNNSATVIKATGINSEDTLKQALLDGGFYKVTESFTISNLVNVPENIKVVVDFAGKTITYNDNWLWTIDGDLTIMDSVGNGGISCGKGAFENHGNLTINGGVINATERSGSTICSGYDFTYIYPDAKLIINDVVVNTINNYAVANFAYFELNGGEVHSTSSSKYGDSNWGYCISNKGAYSNFIANGGIVTGVQGAISITGGSATINNVTAIVNDSDDSHHDSHYALYVAGESGYPSVTVNGGTFTSGYRYAMHVGNKADGGEGNLAMVTVNNGTFTHGSGVESCINVVLTSDNNYGIGSLKINGGNYSTDVSEINGVETCVYNSSTRYYEVNK